MKRLLLLPLLLGLTAPVQAEIDPKVREACLPAADFLGCVKAYSGESLKESTTNSNERIGNSCPPSFAYTGEGYCRKFVCTDLGKEASILIRKHVCKRPATAFFKTRLTWWSTGNKYVPAIHTPKCPNREPGLGWGSTCDEERGLLPEKVSKKKNKLPMACREGIWDKDHPKCQVKVDKIPSSMDMD
tara:strand:- start:80 stop:640 length:561 start_codon:yes stop_codon:yes gene_type:complete